MGTDVSCIGILHRFFDISIESVVLPVTFQFHTFLVDQDSSSMSDALQIKASKDGAIRLKPTTISSRFSIFEGSFVNSIIWEDHAANAIWFAEFVDGADK